MTLENNAPRLVTILNKRGLHARASAKFVTIAEDFDAEVTVTKDGTSVCGTSIMGLMMLAAAIGDDITIQSEGSQKHEVLEALLELVGNKFGEEC